MSETAAAVKEIFEQMSGKLNAASSSGLEDCVIQFNLTGEGGAECYATIQDGSGTLSEGSHDSPSMTMTMEASDFVALNQGELDGMTAFMGGKLKIAGDMGLAMKMQSLFSD